MIERLSSKRYLFIFLVIVIWSVFTDSLFQKGGVDWYMHYAILFLTICLSALYLLPLFSFTTFEKIFYSTLFSVIGLFISLSFTEKILEQIYGYDYERVVSNIIANQIFYSLAISCSIGALAIIRWFKERKESTTA
ncbi:hypothetical protein TH63_04360 [Rufibacter radiotolerans]|uniref:Uncharacterized protein n=1 Tax=Rufibacter radiotolerans TaxID=1379910 RepID=A0A0H4VI42_9BACT|nr:hypothetical protein TH63_04360 [Rufibacter radiotolerans]